VSTVSAILSSDVLLNLERFIADAHRDIGMVAKYAVDACLDEEEGQQLFESSRIGREIVAPEGVGMEP
jgi:hypothetical protein